MQQAWLVPVGIIAGLLLLFITFFAARDAGTKRGMQDAREKIEAEGNITAGPESLLQ